jgi:opacity protein-like surface antigen
VPAPPPPVWLWTGFYVGLHVGGAIGTANFADPFGSSIFGDTVRTPGFIGGGQIGYNWQVPNSQWVFGIQTDISGFASEGTNTCFAYSGSAINTTCRVGPQVAGTVTGRVGYAAGPDGRTLVYVKGGFAWAESHVDMALNNISMGLIGPPISSNSSSFAVWGGTVGAGVEYALTPAWSVLAEYDYLGFTSSNVSNLGSVTVSPIGIITGTIPPGSSGVTQNIHEFKLGVNYKLGVEPWSLGPELPPAHQYPGLGYPWAPGWELETGVRYMYSWGQFHKDLGQSATNGSPTISSISRLTYDDMRTNSGEFFARLDSPWDFFIKGFIGGGRTSSGHMNDEDFGIPPGLVGLFYVPYSNTLAANMTGNIGYGVVDAGYNFLRGPTYKVGAFIGYTQFHQVMNASGCVQIANPFSDCSAANPFSPPIPTSVLGITENDTWKALRIGMSGEVMVTDRVKVAADVAYLPYLNFNGLDTHWQRVPVLLFVESSNGGQGVQLEGLLSYYLTSAFGVGVGGRYWAAWTTNGTYTADGANFTNNFRGAFQQAGIFLQGSYKFSMPVGND